MNIIDVLKTRFSAKEYDTTKVFTEEEIEQLKTILQYAPSSTNCQPWHFVLATTPEGKDRVAKSVRQSFAFNEPKIMKASAVVVFCARAEIPEEYLENVLAKEEADGRYPAPEFKAAINGGRHTFVNYHKYDYKDLIHWSEKQLYLNLGNFLLATAALGFDSVAMEGVDTKVLDAEFGLREKGFVSSIVVAIGKHADNDFNATTPKSRLSTEELIEQI